MKLNLPHKIQGVHDVYCPSVFLSLNIFSANKQILNSHIKRCPKITVSKNPQWGGGGSYLAHGLLCHGSPTLYALFEIYTYLFQMEDGER